MPKTIIITERQAEMLALLNEASAEELYPKYYSNINKDDFDKIVDVGRDPTNPNSNKLGKYAKWLLNLYQNNQLKMEDLYKAEEYIPVFDKMCRVNKIQNKDLNAYKTLPDMYRVVQPYLDKQVVSKSDEVQQIKQEGAEKVYEDSEWLIVNPKTKEAAIYYGKGTQWCTAATTSNNMFDNYNNRGPLHVIINKKTDRKFQYHKESGQFMDEKDKPIDDFDMFPPPILKMLEIVVEVKYEDNTWKVIYFSGDSERDPSYIITDKVNNKKYKYDLSIFWVNGRMWPPNQMIGILPIEVFKTIGITVDFKYEDDTWEVVYFSVDSENKPEYIITDKKTKNTFFYSVRQGRIKHGDNVDHNIFPTAILKIISPEDYGLSESIKNSKRKPKTIIISERQAEMLALLNEASTEELYSKYYSNVNKDDFDKIVDVGRDPTNPNSNKLGKYAKWLLNLYQNKQLKMEDLYKAEEYIPVFDKM